MRTKKLLLMGCLATGISFGSGAQQIVNANQLGIGLWQAPSNTGLAIAPGWDVQAAVYDDGSNNYRINWIESATATIVDQDMNTGNDPDVAYYPNADALAVAYEKGGTIYVDEYYLMTLTPTPDYTLGNTIGVSNGSYPNIDIASTSYGILTWENGGDIFVCTYQMGGNFGPIVYAGSGVQPDAIVTDSYDIAAITYIDLSGDLVIESIDYFGLFSGNYNIVNNWTYTPNAIYEFPRIASERNANYGGHPENFTVVVQDYNSFGSAVVDGFFVTAPGGASMNGPVTINPDFATCNGDYPLPVVAYQRGRVRIAWSQYYPSCTSLSQTNPNNSYDDVFTRDFNSSGTSAGDYLEVNKYQSTFSSFSRNSIAAEYDGNYLVTNSNYHGGILYSDPGDLIWKGIFSGNPSYMPEHGITAEPENNFSLVTSPVDQTIEVLSKSDNFASFEMLDNAGRLVELKTISSSDNVYSIDISHLSGGMYFLNCSSETGNEILRVLQVTK